MCVYDCGGCPIVCGWKFQREICISNLNHQTGPEILCVTKKKITFQLGGKMALCFSAFVPLLLHKILDSVPRIPEKFECIFI